MTYNKSEIMKQAWNWFNDSNIWMSDLEWASYTMTEKTFANCLKTAWAKAKEYAEEAKQEKVAIAKSEELKAWNWAARKLGVEIEVADSKKFDNVTNELKHSGHSISVFSAGMRAVKLHLEIQQSLVA